MRIIGSPIIEFTVSEFQSLFEKKIIVAVELYDTYETDFWIGKMFDTRVYSEHFKKGEHTL